MSIQKTTHFCVVSCIVDGRHIHHSKSPRYPETPAASLSVFHYLNYSPTCAIVYTSCKSSSTWVNWDYTNRCLLMAYHALSFDLALRNKV